MSELGNKEVMAKNIKKYMQKFNISQTKICSELDLKQSTFSDWVNAKTYPRIDKIELLANYFGINKSDLVEDANSFEIKQIHKNHSSSLNDFGDIIRRTRINKGLTINDVVDIIKKNKYKFSIEKLEMIEDGTFEFTASNTFIILTILAEALETSITYFYMDDPSVINAFVSRFGTENKEIIDKLTLLNNDNIKKVSEYIDLLVNSQKQEGE